MLQDANKAVINLIVIWSFELHRYMIKEDGIHFNQPRILPGMWISPKIPIIMFCVNSVY